MVSVALHDIADCGMYNGTMARRKRLKLEFAP